MDIHQENEMLQIVQENFDAMRSMITNIQIRLQEKPGTVQYRFIQPIMAMITEAVRDANNEDDSFLTTDTPPITVG